MIKHVGSRYQVLSSRGRRLGTHKTKKKAVKQLRAIEANKHKMGKK